MRASVRVGATHRFTAGEGGRMKSVQGAGHQGWMAAHKKLLEDQGGTDLGETGAGKDKKADRASVRKKKRGQKDTVIISVTQPRRED